MHVQEQGGGLSVSSRVVLLSHGWTSCGFETWVVPVLPCSSCPEGLTHSSGDEVGWDLSQNPQQLEPGFLSKLTAQDPRIPDWVGLQGA